MAAEEFTRGALFGLRLGIFYASTDAKSAKECLIEHYDEIAEENGLPKASDVPGMEKYVRSSLS